MKEPEITTVADLLNELAVQLGTELGSTAADLLAESAAVCGDKPLRELGLFVERGHKYGVCWDCGKKIENKYTSCTSCADQNGP